MPLFALILLSKRNLMRRARAKLILMELMEMVMRKPEKILKLSLISPKTISTHKTSSTLKLSSIKRIQLLSPLAMPGQRGALLFPSIRLEKLACSMREMIASCPTFGVRTNASSSSSKCMCMVSGGSLSVSTLLVAISYSAAATVKST